MLIKCVQIADFEATSHFDAPAKRFRGAFRPDCGLFCPFRVRVSRSSRMMRVPSATQVVHAHQVVGGKAQQRLPRWLGVADELGLGQAVHCLGPAKGLLDALAHLLTGVVALVPSDAGFHRSVLDRLDQLALAADGEQYLQQQSLEQQHLWRRRWSATARIPRVELAVHRREQCIDHGAQFAQRVCLQHSLFKADAAEHRPLEVWVASRLDCHSCSGVASDRNGSRRQRGRVFQRPANWRLL
jgi:hypothetical protein